jgi:hypothetical protein
MKTWEMRVEVRALCDADEMHPDDRNDCPVGNHTYFVDADSDQEASEKALDQFHSEVPISVPEDFDIDVFPAGLAPDADTPTPEIEVAERLMDPGKYHASLAGGRGVWGAGDTPDEAIGALVRCNPEKFGLKVTQLEGKHPR